MSRSATGLPRYWFIALVLVLLFAAGYTFYRTQDELLIENTAHAMFVLECRSVVNAAFIQEGRAVDEALVQAACNSGNFEAHKDTIVACYRDDGADRFTECVADKGIRNPP